jgi:hypothetical protein
MFKRDIILGFLFGLIFSLISAYIINRAFTERERYTTDISMMRCQENKLVHYFYYQGKIYAVCKDTDGYMIVK